MNVPRAGARGRPQDAHGDAGGVGADQRRGARSSSSAAAAGAAGPGRPRTGPGTRGTGRAGPAPTGCRRRPARGSGPASLVVAGERLQRRLLPGVVGVAGEDLDVVPGGHVLQLDAAAEHAQQGRRLVDRQVGVRPAVGDDRDVLPGVEREPRHHPADQVDAVARQHPEVVAGTVRRALRQRDLQVPGRPWRGGAVAAWISSRFCAHLRRAGVVGHDDRVGQLAVGQRDRQARATGADRGDLGRQVQRPGERRPRGRRARSGTAASKSAGGVALTARVHPAPAVSRQLLVEQRRHGLVRRGPLGVAAAEHRVRDAVGGRPGRRR